MRGIGPYEFATVGMAVPELTDLKSGGLRAANLLVGVATATYRYRPVTGSVSVTGWELCLN